MTNEFWSMGGYAAFVWPCFAFVAGILLWNVWSARRCLASARTAAVRAIAMADSEVA
jgi:heme exporter protein CcmD